MADDISASIHQLHQPQPRRPKTAAERGRAFRQRQREKAGKVAPATVPATSMTFPVRPANVPNANAANVAANVPNAPRTRERRSFGTILLATAAIGLGAVGITMNGWFARSLGASDVAGWLFLAIGVAADLVALSVPSVAARAWQARQRATAAAGWVVWAMTFAFAVMSGVGFAALNISDVTTSRASRVTPAVAAAQVALADAMAARDRECKGGVGRWCRDREGTVADRQRSLESAMHTVGETADPQTEAAIHVVAWLTRGALKPEGRDFAMLRLALLALLPQVGGILLMLSRVNNRPINS